MRTDLEKLARVMERDVPEQRLRELIQRIVGQLEKHEPDERSFVYKDDEGRSYEITVKKTETSK